MSIETENKNTRPHYEGEPERIISASEIYNDLNKIEEELGSDSVKALCAVVVSKLSFWSWPGLRDGFIKSYNKEKQKNKTE